MNHHLDTQKSQPKEAREALIHRIGQELAAKMPMFYGSIRFNIFGGHYQNANIEESVKPNGVIKKI